jgi:tellurite resistance protein TerB
MGFMSFMGKKLSNSFSFAKVENRDKMEAIICASVYVMASSDAGITNEKVSTMEKLIATNDSLSHFGSEIPKTIKKFTDMFDAGFDMGEIKALREIDDVRNTPEDAEEVFIQALEIAKAGDGEIDDKEKRALTKIAQTVGVNASHWLK